jgi:hypothetical protein
MLVCVRFLGSGSSGQQGEEASVSLPFRDFPLAKGPAVVSLSLFQSNKLFSLQQGVGDHVVHVLELKALDIVNTLPPVHVLLRFVSHHMRSGTMLCLNCFVHTPSLHHVFQPQHLTVSLCSASGAASDVKNFVLEMIVISRASFVF